MQHCRAENVRHHTDVLALLLQQRPLLDVQLHESVHAFCVQLGAVNVCLQVTDQAAGACSGEGEMLRDAQPPAWHGHRVSCLLLSSVLLSRVGQRACRLEARKPPCAAASAKEVPFSSCHPASSAAVTLPVAMRLQ